MKFQINSSRIKPEIQSARAKYWCKIGRVGFVLVLSVGFQAHASQPNSPSTKLNQQTSSGVQAGTNNTGAGKGVDPNAEGCRLMIGLRQIEFGKSDADAEQAIRDCIKRNMGEELVEQFERDQLRKRGGQGAAKGVAAHQEEVRQQIAKLEERSQQKANLDKQCSAISLKQTEVIDARTSIYGLILGAPLPPLNNCDGGTKGSPMCLYTSALSPPAGVSPWGTQTLVVYLNEDVFDHSVSYGTRYPTLELVGGKIVGILFEGLGGSTDEFLALLSQKFGKYQRSGDTYSWVTPAANVRLDKERHSRLVTTGQVDLLHPFGEGISSERYFANTITIYTPTIRCRVDAYKAEQALKNKKKGF